VPPRIKATTLESQLIHLIQELSGRTLRVSEFASIGQTNQSIWVGFAGIGVSF
jgi:hypothetical protein